MNVRKFKEIVSEWDHSTENFRLLRSWINNCYDFYQKDMAIEYWETERYFQDTEDFVDSADYRNLNLEWKYIGYGSLTKLYNRMGWEMDEEFKQIEMKYDDTVDCVYYGLDFQDVYSKIQVAENDIEFAYAVLSLIGSLSTARKLYKKFADKVYEGIRECNLEECIKLLDDGRTKQAFIAMSFDDSMKTARKSIVKAVEDSGYKAMLIDIKEHNNQIVPEIYREIEESEFVVADLTGQRGGVYYEAGYAVAKDKPLILSCKKSTEEKPHFDVAQINTIFWEDEGDLYTRLAKRIKATIK